jgi:xeroderma pigmentosum group C-complementing protein
LSYPVYWVEAFNTAHQKWIPIDPHSTCTTDKPEKLEPPLNYSQNSLAYVLAFEEDYTAKDVTRRYAKAYNAKTRKLRLESIEGGTKWLKKALKPFRRTVPLDRDQVEDAALARKEAAEGIPKNVQDFKNHPIYVLERHLRHNEVIHPMHQVGKVNVGSSLNPKMEPIYRRKDVHIVRSADKWYRLGRDVKDGEQPLKHAKPKRGGARSLPPDAEGDEQTEEVGAGLYAVFQTELYVPPPVVHGRVPRNAFGNLDLYVPSMVPPGGAHIRHKLAAKAARILGVDSVDAVTGFSFKGRHGTAVIQGVVVAEEYQEAVEAVIDAMEYAQEEAENKQRSDEALRTWRRFLLGLRIAQRVNAIEIDGETGPVVDFQEEIEKEDRQITEDQLAGGFFMDDRVAAEPMPRVSNRGYQDEAGGGGFVPGNHEAAGGFIPDHHEAGGGFIPDDAEQSGGFIPKQAEQAGGFIPNDNDHAGCFIPDDDDDDQAGGFIPEPKSTPKAPYTPHKVLSPEPSSSHPVAAPLPQNDGSADDIAGGFIPADGDGDLPMQDALDAVPGECVTAVQASDTGLTQDIRNVAVAEETQGVDVSSEVARDETDASPQQERPESEPVEKGEPEPPNSSPSDAGSLPLEDPEDEDADPDWLVDAT